MGRCPGDFRPYPARASRGKVALSGQQLPWPGEQAGMGTKGWSGSVPVPWRAIRAEAPDPVGDLLRRGARLPGRGPAPLRPARAPRRSSWTLARAADRARSPGARSSSCRHAGPAMSGPRDPGRSRCMTSSALRSMTSSSGTSAEGVQLQLFPRGRCSPGPACVSWRRSGAGTRAAASDSATTCDRSAPNPRCGLPGVPPGCTAGGAWPSAAARVPPRTAATTRHRRRPASAWTSQSPPGLPGCYAECQA